MKFIRVTGLAAMLLFPWPVVAADQLRGTCAGVTGEVLDAGLARGELVKETASPNAPSGVDWQMTNIRLVERTNRIPLTDGSIMLVSYRLSGLPVGQPINIRTVVEFPPMIDTNGRSKTKEEGTLKLSGNSDKTGQEYWTFASKYPLEMVSGLWAFNYFYKDCQLFRKEFQAFKP